MRQSFRVEALRNDKDEFVGFMLGPGGCAEHEWGVERLYSTLGIDSSIFGINGRTVQNAEPITFVKSRGFRAIGVSDWDNFSDESILRHHELGGTVKTKNDVDLFAAWSERDFCVGAKKKESYPMIEELFKAAKKNDLVVYLGGGDNKNPFAKSGLIIAIKSKLDSDLADIMYEHDKRHFEKMKLHKSLNLEPRFRERFQSPSKFCFAVSPYWLDELNERVQNGFSATKHPIVYWLNATNLYGWFTVEDIREWINNGTGAIADAIAEKEKVKAGRA